MDEGKNVTFTEETISLMTASDLIKNAPHLYDISDTIEREQIRAFFLLRAKNLKVKTTVVNVLKAYDREEDALIKASEKERKLSRIEDSGLPLKCDSNGNITNSIDNYLTIMQNDLMYSGIRYNVLLNAAEVERVRDGKKLLERWCDADLSNSRNYIENEYGIYSKDKHRDALNILFSEREYNPVLNILSTVEWDGEERCCEFLVKWGKAEDTPYTREVSRLIFSGGINRMMIPGCKFDDVPVLIGKQGSGKSSLCRFLAINDDYFGEVKTVDGDKAIEQLNGKWVLEIAELSAFTKAKEVEAVKAFITRQRDQYRKPYSENIDDRPRRCVFVGTTNNPNFLVDPSGNRRFYPVTVNCNGYDIFDKEQEIREYILQCWAEAMQKFKDGNMKPFADRSLVNEYREAQDNAMQDDWRVGAIEEYLSKKPIGSFTCIKEIKVNALNNGNDTDVNPKESKEIAIIMSKIDGWEKTSKREYTQWGQQRGYIKTSGEEAEELPL